ncbi:MAG: hypothetical protein HY906_28385 [Deltaproteobacteria bacterium]|nr:hypothetical protein [Deltaproteobacteria bacterium]
MRAWLVIMMIGMLTSCEQRQDFVSGQADGGVEASARDSGVDSASPVDAGTLWFDGGLPTRACDPPQTDAGVLPPVVAVWDGYMENPLLSDSDAVHLVFRSSESGELSATVIFGTGTPPPSPPDSETCYPEGLGTSGLFAPLVIEGFEYPSVAPSMSDIRLRIPLLADAPWTDWCACQVPVETGGAWACLPNMSSRATPDGQCFLQPPGAQEIPVPCCKLRLCNLTSVCQCTESACAIDSTTFWTLDLSVNGNRADGTLSIAPSSGVHLQRTQ